MCHIQEIASVSLDPDEREHDKFKMSRSVLFFKTYFAWSSFNCNTQYLVYSVVLNLGMKIVTLLLDTVTCLDVVDRCMDHNL